MDIFDVLTLIGGLSLFLFGMKILGDPLEKQAGRKLKPVLANLTNNRVKGFLLGMGVTAIIQSSSATTVMAVGLVSAGVMTLHQSVGIIIGANVGTTITAWILSLTGIQSENIWLRMLKPSAFVPILALIGIYLLMFKKSSKKKDIGTVLLGFAVLMFGMETMSGAVSSLKDVPEFRNMLLMFSNPIFGIIAGAVLTGIIQSSSASVGILQALSTTGAVTYSAAIPLIMGMNIGSCATAMLASVTATKEGKRAAMIHLYFNIIGVAISLSLFYVLKAIIGFTFTSNPANEFGIALTHTSLKLIMTVFLLPAIKLLEKLAHITVKDAPQAEEFKLLDERLLATPSLAVDRCRTTTIEMANLSVDILKKSMVMLKEYNPKTAEYIREGENKVDQYEDKIGSYLIKISTQSLASDDSHETTRLLRFIGDFERISDHAVNILDSAEELKDKKLSFSSEAKRELSVLTAAIDEVLTLTLQAFAENNMQIALQVEPLEQVVDYLKEQIKLNHSLRLQKLECSIEHGFILSDILNNFERVSDHCSNIAGMMLEMSQHEAMDMHKYLRSVKAGGEDFDRKYREYRKKYSL